MAITILLVVFFSIALVILIKNISSINQLKYQNRLLRALRSLDIVALSTTELEPLCQAIVDVIHKELGYFMALIMLVDYEKRCIRRVTLSRIPGGDEILKILPTQIKDQVVPLTDEDNTLVKVVNTKNKIYINDLYEIQRGVIPQEITQKLQQQLRSRLNIKGFFLYPLITKNKVIGIIEYPSTLEEGKVPKFELNVMEEFTAEVARTLENVMLYENLSSVSRKLEKANLKLMELDRLKDDFVSITSHELRTPMAAIRSYAWMALHRSGVKLPDNLERYLIRVLLSTERLINLVNDMLNISRIESGRIEINPEQVDMSSLIKDIVDEVYYSKSKEKNIQIIILEQTLPKVFADPEKLRQVFLNIMGNAIKFSPGDGKITVGFFTDGITVETYIKDQGPGISKDDMGRLFQKFGRLDSSYVATATSGGTGLGLYISKSLIELMHGRVWASSDGLGKGATFTISLPVSTQAVSGDIEKYRVIAKGEAKGLEPVAI